MNPRALLGWVVVQRISCCLVFVAVVSCHGSDTRTTHTVQLDSASFTPTVVVARVGDLILWKNADILVHTVTSELGGFDSRDIPAGGSWSFTTTREGSFAYLCRYHPTMRGTVRVR